MNKKIAKIKEKLEDAGLYVTYGKLQENPYLTVFKKETNTGWLYSFIYN